MSEHLYTLQPIGWVESSLTNRDAALKQGDEGEPDAWLVFDPTMHAGIRDLAVGAEIIVLTWLDRARRDVSWISSPCSGRLRNGDPQLVARAFQPASLASYAGGKACATVQCLR